MPIMESSFRRVTAIHRASAFTTADKVITGFCFAAVAFLSCGNLVHIERVPLSLSSLSPIDPHEPLMSGTGFASNAVYPTTAPPSFQGNLKFYGSWLRSNTPIGSVHSQWYRPVPQFYFFVAGYPKHSGNQVFTEVQTAHSGIIRLPFSNFAEPRESWWLNKVSLRGIQEPVRFRIVAVDGSTKFWLGISQPFLIRAGASLSILKQLLLVILATAASIVVFFFPGLVLCQKLFQSRGWRLPFICVPLPGLFLLTVLGLLSWIGPDQLKPAWISRAGLWALVLYLGYRLLRAPVSTFTSVTETRVLVVTTVLVAIAVGKSIYSVGPVGELFQDNIVRTLEVGARSDSAVSYNIVQLVASRSRPFSYFAQSLYQTWNFSHRGPINGLAASPVVLASPVEVTRSTTRSQSWTPFDPEGFSAYRIAMIVMASCSLLTVFGLARLFLPEQWAFLAFLVAGTAPFVVHELYFTWPKLSSAAFVLLGAYLVLQSRYLLAGLSLGVGYLCHPSALVWFPCLLGVLVLSPPSAGSREFSVPRKFYVWSLRTLSMVAGVAICVLMWKRINGKHFGQGLFTDFLFQAWIYPRTPAYWLWSRFQSLSNTLVPLSLFMFDRGDPYMNSLEGASPAVVQFFFQYWNTLPFGTGIAFFCFGLIRLVYVAFWKARAWLLLVFVVPLALFTVYWGASISGMLRENLHAWFLGLMIFAVIIWKKYMAHSTRFWRICSWALLFRGVEILLMLLLPAISTQHMLLQNQFAITDITALLIMLGGTAWLSVYTFRFAEHLRTVEGKRSYAIR
jgi:hypothetical protein